MNGKVYPVHLTVVCIMRQAFQLNGVKNNIKHTCRNYDFSIDFFNRSDSRRRSKSGDGKITKPLQLGAIL